ncbi:MAG: flavohemoprotein [Alphaproteobacteria bacterium]|nr:flavohemoprotein [Alphaproteobacteria bacterium]
MSLDVEALRESFELVLEREPLVASRFYPILFERYPQVQPLFGRHSGPEQQRMLTDMLAKVIEHLEDPGWMKGELAALGRRHVDYEVTAEMYPWVGECLVATLAEVAGDDWCERYESAWLTAYGAITEMTLAGYPDPSGGEA